jgi:GNAT superfamily N-acetyltransferase
VTALTFRTATSADAPAVAALHADSWRRHYRGAYRDSFLDGDVVGDRLAVWTARLSPPLDTAQTLLAEDGDVLVGFAHTILDVDERWGALLDNLHVRADRQRSGTGRALLARSANFVRARRPACSLYLWVLEQNLDAQQFYARLGGRIVERAPVPDVGGVPGRLNGEVHALRVVWSLDGTLVT